MSRAITSRQRFDHYKKRLADSRRLGKTDPHDATRKVSRSRSFVTLLRIFWHLLGAHRLTLLTAMGVLMVSVLVGLIPLYAPKIVVDSVLNHHPLPRGLVGWLPSTDSPRTLLLTVCGISLTLVVFATTIGLWGRWQATRIAKRMQVDVRRKAFDHASRLPLHRVYELRSGGVASILRDDAGAVGQLVFDMLYNPWRAIVQLVGSLTILIFVDWRLLLIGALLLPVVWLTHRTWISRIRPMWRDVRRTRQQVDADATEAFSGMRIVRAFGKRRSEANRFTRTSGLMIRQELHAWWWMRGIDTAWAILIPFASALLLLLGGMQILSDRAAVTAGTLDVARALTVGDLVAFLTYLTALLAPIAALAATATSLQNNLAGLDRISDLLEEPTEMVPPPGALRLDKPHVKGHLQLQHVSFTYPGALEPALTEIDLEIQPGTTLAFVGPSGAGKTTLCNLIARFYDPTAGRILLDGVDLCDIHVDTYRNQLGIVEQDIFLFDGTIADNISYASRQADKQAIIAAAQQANAHAFIEQLDHGYDTLVGERGIKLSGGQRQRLAIARALLADPKILILDEATSALDTQSERLIQASLQTLVRGRTCFVIAHRLSTITHADHIVVIDHGRIIEQGTHPQLLSQSGAYRDMVHLQLTPPPPVEMS